MPKLAYRFIVATDRLSISAAFRRDMYCGVVPVSIIWPQETKTARSSSEEERGPVLSVITRLRAACAARQYSFYPICYLCQLWFWNFSIIIHCLASEIIPAGYSALPVAGVAVAGQSHS